MAKKRTSKKKPILVTGASGFLGLHLTRVLREAGHPVRSLGRSRSERLAALEVDQRLGSVTDPEAVAAAVDGVAAIYHCAGWVSRDKGERGAMYRVHIDGTRAVLQAALDAGIDDVLVVSTSGTVGVSDHPDFVADEDSPIAWALVREWPYYESKAYAEREVAAFVERGLPVKMARPTLLLGPGDYNGSSTGDVVKYLCGDIKASLPGGMSAVDVRDVADALPKILAEGEPGVGYLLGSVNCTVREFMVLLEQASGVRAPAMSLPRPIVDRAGGLLKAVSRLKPFGGLEPQTFEMGCHHWYLDSTRATRLGFAPRPIQDTLRDTVEDLRGHRSAAAAAHRECAT